MGSKSPPPKKKASYLELVSVMGVWLMIFQYFTQIHSCLPRNTKNGKGSNFPMLSLPRSRRAAIVDKMSNHCRASELHLEVFRMPLSKPENDTYMAFGQIISFGGCGVFFCSFACFRAKDRPAFCLILRNLLPCAAEQETFGIERSQFCAAGPSRMLSIGFGSSRVPFLCQKKRGVWQGCLQVDVFTPRDATGHWDVFVEGEGGFDNMSGTFQVSYTVNCSKR